MPAFCRSIHIFDMLHVHNGTSITLPNHSRRAQTSVRTNPHMRKAKLTHRLLQYDRYLQGKAPCKRS